MLVFQTSSMSFVLRYTAVALPILWNVKNAETYKLMTSVMVHCMKLVTYKVSSGPKLTSKLGGGSMKIFRSCYTGNILKQCEQATLPKAAKYKT